MWWINEYKIIYGKFYVHVTVHRNKFLYNKTTKMHQFPKFTPAWNSTLFGQFLYQSSGVYSLYTRHWYMSYRFEDSFRAGPAGSLSIPVKKNTRCCSLNYWCHVVPLPTKQKPSLVILETTYQIGRSRLLWGQSRSSAAARFHESRVRLPMMTWIFVSFVGCVFCR
jgi:hypothetical protein